jgi:hypothetical protein
MKLRYRKRFIMARAASNSVKAKLPNPDSKPVKGRDNMQNQTISATPSSLNAVHVKSNTVAAKDFKLQELTMLSITPILRVIHHWWLQRAEKHYLICADVEERRAREAQMNVAYYQKRAALARSARYYN